MPQKRQQPMQLQACAVVVEVAVECMNHLPLGHTSDMTIAARTICLCCGSYYDAEGSCPQVRYKPHSIQIALEVSRRLLKDGIEHPDKHDVQETLRELGYR